MKRRAVAIALGGLIIVTASLVFASTARATSPPCEVTGHLEASTNFNSTPSDGSTRWAAPSYSDRPEPRDARTGSAHRFVTGVFHVDATCAEVSVSSWLAPDAHAGQPQTLYDRHAESDVAPGDYRWTITAPPEGCFVQDDLELPGGYTIDFILGGDHVCQPPSTTTSTSTPPLSTTSTPTTSVPPNPSAPSASSVTVAPSPPASTPSAVIGTQSTPTEELAFSGGGELWALTLSALGLIGFGRWVEYQGKRRRER